MGACVCEYMRESKSVHCAAKGKGLTDREGEILGRSNDEIFKVPLADML